MALWGDRDDNEHGKDEDLDYPFGLSVIGHYATRRLAHDAGLAVLAAGHPYWVYAVDGRYALTVQRSQAAQLRREIELTEQKNRFWPPSPLSLPTRSIGKGPTLVFGTALMVFFFLQKSNPALEALGMNSSEGVILQGEWWRIITAITLHADVGHLASNLLGIGLFAYFCCRYMGNGLAWLLIVGVASFSNLTNAFLKQSEPFCSLGASTAVFAALGLLAGYPIGSYARTREPIETKDWLVPLLSGCVLFAWMGGGDFPTDVTGHLWSFLYGGLVALPVARFSIESKIPSIGQKALLGVAALVIGASWYWAVAS